MKPTKVQKEALAALLRDGERSAYPSLSMSTLDALARHGLANRRAVTGHMYSPRTGILYAITDEGRAVLAAYE